MKDLNKVVQLGTYPTTIDNLISDTYLMAFTHMIRLLFEKYPHRYKKPKLYREKNWSKP